MRFYSDSETPRDNGRIAISIPSIAMLAREHYDAFESVRRDGSAMTISISLALSILAMVLGAFVAASPGRAANIFASGRLEALPPQNRASYLRFYRAFGIILCLGGMLLALDSLGFW
jgi:hypothetical protein